MKGEDCQSGENTLRETAVCHHTLVQTCRMCTAESEPQGKLGTLGDNAVSVGVGQL